MTPATLVKKERILEYLDNMMRQLEDIESIPVPSKSFFLEKEKGIQNKSDQIQPGLCHSGCESGLRSYRISPFSLESSRK